MNHLYNTLFDGNTHTHTDDTNDIALEIINSIHGHTNFNIISNYFDIDDYDK